MAKVAVPASHPDSDPVQALVHVQGALPRGADPLAACSSANSAHSSSHATPAAQLRSRLRVLAPRGACCACMNFPSGIRTNAEPP